MDIFILVISALIAIAAIIYNPAKTYGVPAALIFIFAGLFIGNGEFIPTFDYPNETEFLSQFALSIIIFTGAFQTPFSRIKPILAEGLMLANFGVIITALVFGLLVSFVTSLNFLEGLLLGSIIASTDAAATYSILDSKKLKLKYNADKVLELESATNDPIAMILTLMFSIMLVGEENHSGWYYGLYFLQQLVIGALVAIVIAYSLKHVFKLVKFSEEFLKPVFLLSSLLVTIELAGMLNGNSLVAAFVLGIILGNTEFPFKQTSGKFFASASWLGQAIMFVILGLQIFPDKLINAFVPSLIPAIALFVFIRPLAVILTYVFFKQPSSKKLFISWIGIKGATPIVFALVPLIMKVPNSELIFNITVIIVIFSMIVHGFTLKYAATKLKMLE
jgi:cell volume regulation protein A